MSKISYGFRLRFIRIPLLTFVPSIFCFSGTEGKQAAFRKTILEGDKTIMLGKAGEEQIYMSAFLVDKTTIDRIVTFINRECVNSEYFREQLEKELNIDFADADWRSKLGQKMLDLNQLALGFRYGDEELKLRYFYSDVSGFLSKIQLFKSLQCWMYQCTEGDIPEKSKLYKVFREKIVLHLAVSIVQSMSEYDEAEWS